MVMPESRACPSTRLRPLNDLPAKPGGQYVLYWMTAARRTQWNYALDRAIEVAVSLGKPLIVLEALRCDYPWASERIHQFIMQGMADNLAAFQGTGIQYYPYVEPAIGAGKGLLRSLAEDACIVITDDSPVTFLPRMVRAGSELVGVRMEGIDSNGILPLGSTPKAYFRAHDFRRFLQRELKPHLAQPPKRDPISETPLRSMRELPGAITRRWPVATSEQLTASSQTLSSLPINHEIQGVSIRGGQSSGSRVLAEFVEKVPGLGNYGTGRNHPDASSTSGLSPFLHFGHISAHEVLHASTKRAHWTPEKIRPVRNGTRIGWWGLREETESFLDQLVTWRELGLNFARNRDDIQKYSSLPDWAQTTLSEHASDVRPHSYTKSEFEAAATHNALWNAAQTELKRTGRMHNYLRMLWGKKILHWSPSPELAAEIMLELNDKYALDGRDPNSYSGIFWVLGRYDRPWGPERDVFGKVRYMSSKNTLRKLRLSSYLAKWSPEGCGTPTPGKSHG